jgi:hypothetical protein
MARWRTGWTTDLHTGTIPLMATPQTSLGTVYGIGHSNHPITEFYRLLTLYNIREVLDVRSHPNLTRWPQYQKDAIRDYLRSAGMSYYHVPRLGGRPMSTQAELDAYLPNWLPFREPTVLMCAEGKYLECHRHYNLTPALRRAGLRVLQIRPDGSVVEDTGPTPEKLISVAEHLPPQDRPPNWWTKPAKSQMALF